MSTRWQWAIVALVLLPTGLTAQRRLGAFRLHPSRDAITDSDQTWIGTPELHPTALRNATLIWRCQGRTGIELFVAADQFLNSEDPVPLVWRFDRQPPSQPQTWNVSTNGTGAFAPEEMIPVFTEAARKASVLVIRLEDYRGVDTDLSFSMSGSNAALGALPCFAAIGAIVKRAQTEARERLEARARRQAERARQDSLARARRDSINALVRIVVAKADSFPWGAAKKGKYFYPTATFACWRSVAADDGPLVFFRSHEEAIASGRTEAPGCRKK